LDLVRWNRWTQKRGDDGGRNAVRQSQIFDTAVYVETVEGVSRPNERKDVPYKAAEPKRKRDWYIKLDGHLPFDFLDRGIGCKSTGSFVPFKNKDATRDKDSNFLRLWVDNTEINKIVPVFEPSIQKCQFQSFLSTEPMIAF
jgi:hypothetical protein